MKRVWLCFIWGIFIFAMNFRDAYSYVVTSPYSKTLQEYLEKQGFDDPLLPFLLAKTTRDKEQEVVINRYRLEQEQIVRSRQAINKDLLPSVIASPEPKIPTESEVLHSTLMKVNDSEIDLKVLHWHLSTDDPGESVKTNKNINSMLIAQLDHSLFTVTRPDVVVFTGVELLQKFAQLDMFCEIYLKEFYTADYVSRVCNIKKDPERVYAGRSNHLLHSGNILVISQYPLRGIESTTFAPYRYCMMYGGSAQQQFYGFALYFQVFLEKRWLKFATIASYDYLNLAYPGYNWKNEWKSCLVNSVKPDLEFWLAEDEVAVVITRIFNPKLNPLAEQLKDWMRLTHKKHSGPVTDFDPAQNTLAANLSWFYRYTLIKTQLVHFSLFKNSPRKRLKNFGAPLQVLAIADGRNLEANETQRTTIFGLLLSIFFTALPEEKKDFVPFYPSLAKVKLPYHYVPESNRDIPLPKGVQGY